MTLRGGVEHVHGVGIHIKGSYLRSMNVYHESVSLYVYEPNV